MKRIGAMLAEHDASSTSASAILDRFCAQGRGLRAERLHRLCEHILRIGFAAAFGEPGMTPSADRRIERIALSPMTMGPHPEAPDVLRRLRERRKLATFTSPDNDLIALTVAHKGLTSAQLIWKEWQSRPDLLREEPCLLTTRRNA